MDASPDEVKGLVHHEWSGRIERATAQVEFVACLCSGHRSSQIGMHGYAATALQYDARELGMSAGATEEGDQEEGKCLCSHGVRVVFLTIHRGP